ncbi:uncharacterized protein LOC129624225 [Bubalus kerabau]|uniref:uncharacterized protein LOC129624225 n=1 Tax=Bubalus carabanensis TaxID=3119969 RepID=UPI00244E8AA9|nr:uncharacterized protein LOC129624225 [Bubalus carabanensis]
MLSAEGPQTTFLKHLTLAARARLVKLQLESRWRRAGEGRRLPAGSRGPRVPQLWEERGLCLLPELCYLLRTAGDQKPLRSRPHHLGRSSSHETSPGGGVTPRRRRKARTGVDAGTCRCGDPAASWEPRDASGSSKGSSRRLPLASLSVQLWGVPLGFRAAWPCDARGSLGFDVRSSGGALSLPQVPAAWHVARPEVSAPPSLITWHEMQNARVARCPGHKLL